MKLPEIPVVWAHITRAPAVLELQQFWLRTERTAVAAIQLRVRMRILMRPENSLANLSRQISNIKLQIKLCEGIP